MYIKFGPVSIGKPRNPGATTLETPSFDGLIKQHEQRKTHLEFRIEALGKDYREVVRHFNEQRSALTSELDVITKRIEGLKTLTGKF